MAGWMTIELKGLRFFAEHGMYVEERKVGNQFEIDLCISYKAPKSVIVNIEQTVNYVEVYRLVEEVFSAHKYLLETCAMEICDVLQKNFNEIRHVSISIKKMNAPITNFTGSVGITYQKKFK